MERIKRHGGGSLRKVFGPWLLYLGEIPFYFREGTMKKGIFAFLLIKEGPGCKYDNLVLILGHILNVGVAVLRVPLVKIFRNHHWG